MANNIYRCSVALFGGRRALSDYHIHRYVLLWWHSIDAMLVLPASMASPRVVPLARHVGLKSCTHCTSAPLYQLHDIGLATPFFFQKRSSIFLIRKGDAISNDTGPCPLAGLPWSWVPSSWRRRSSAAPARRSNACGCCRRGAFGSIIQRSGAWRKRGRPGVHRDARFHARVAVRARSALCACVLRKTRTRRDMVVARSNLEWQRSK